LPRDAGFETLAGFLQFQLGYIPREGQTEEIWRAQPRNTSKIDTSPLNSTLP
jgi:CBS domain containing-hemolysin-like protein